MEVISSSANQWAKLASSLASAASARREHQLIFVEGVHLVEAFLQSKRTPNAHERLLVAEKSLEVSEVRKLYEAWVNGSGKVVVFNEKVFKTFSQLEHALAIALIVSPPTYSFQKDVANDAIYFDAVQDPGNLGTMLRSAVATGVEQCLSSPQSASLWSPKVLRAGMGAHFLCQVQESVSHEALFEMASVQKKTIRITSGYAEKILFDVNLSDASIWVMGNEGQGVDLDRYSALSERYPQVNIEWVRLPIVGVESLNVSAAAAVCLYEQMRQRRANRKS